MFSFFQREPAPPKVIFLRGEPRREGLDIRENPEDLSELLSELAPAPLRLRLPQPIPGLEAVLGWAWLERGYRIPPLVVEVGPRFSLTVLDQAETFHELQHEFFTPEEVVQLELAGAVAATIARFVHRDYVAAQAQAAGVEVDPRLLSRLSKYLRGLLQAGRSLPEPHRWPELASSAPFDEIGRGLEPLQLRTPLPGPRRSQLLLQVLEGQEGGPETWQAIEEFWVASGQVFPEFSLDPRTLLRDFLRHPLPGLRRWAEQNADYAGRITGVEKQPAPTLPRFARLALLAHDLSREQRRQIESYLGPLPPVLATPAQERLARQRLGP